MGHLIVVVGLPGSGKSRFIVSETDRLRNAGELMAQPIHDYMHQSIGNSPDPRNSSYLEQLRADLAAGKTCLVADIAFTESRTRRALLGTLHDIPALLVDWVFFANDLEQCLRNIRWHQAKYGKNDSSREDAARRFSPLYEIPTGFTVLPVGIAGAE